MENLKKNDNFLSIEDFFINNVIDNKDYINNVSGLIKAYIDNTTDYKLTLERLYIFKELLNIYNLQSEFLKKYIDDEIIKISPIIENRKIVQEKKEFENNIKKDNEIKRKQKYINNLFKKFIVYGIVSNNIIKYGNDITFNKLTNNYNIFLTSCKKINITLKKIHTDDNIICGFQFYKNENEHIKYEVIKENELY